MDVEMSEMSEGGDRIHDVGNRRDRGWRSDRNTKNQIINSTMLY